MIDEMEIRSARFILISKNDRFCGVSPSNSMGFCIQQIKLELLFGSSVMRMTSEQGYSSDRLSCHVIDVFGWTGEKLKWANEKYD